LFLPVFELKYELIHSKLNHNVCTYFGRKEWAGVSLYVEELRKHWKENWIDTIFVSLVESEAKENHKGISYWDTGNHRNDDKWVPK
jgi:hypothetical protein